MPITFGNVGGAEPSTVTFRVGTVDILRGSTHEQQEILVVGDPQTSNALARVTAAPPASTEFGLLVRIASGPSSASDLLTQISGNSTVIQGTSPWVIGGASSVRANLSSTAADNPVQISGNSTVIQGTNPWVVTPSSTSWASSAGFHFDSSGALSVAAVFTGSTTVNVSSVAGKVLVSPFSTTPEPAFSFRLSDGSTWVVDYTQGSTFTSTAVAGGINFLRVGQSSISSTDTFVMPWGSTAGAQIMAFADSSGGIVLPADSANTAIRVNVVAGAAGGSTIVTVSTIQGVVSVAPMSTSWASSAGFHFDSSGALQTVASFTGSTTVNVSSLAGTVTIAGNSTVIQGTTPWVVGGASSIRANLSSTAADNPVQISGNSTVVQGTNPWIVAPSSTGWASSAGLHFDSSGALQVRNAGYVQTSTFTSTAVTGGVPFLRVGASSVSSTDTLIMGWASTAGAQIVATVDSSGGIVLPGDSANNAMRVNVIASARSNIGSTAADNAVSISGNSTVIQGTSPWVVGFQSGNISSAAQSGNSSGLTVRPVWSSSGVDQPVRANLSSTSADNPVTASQTGTWTVNVGTHIQSSVAPSSGSSGIVVRQVIDGITAFASTNALASTSLSVVSSVANIRAYVTAYTITSSNQTPAQWGFFSSNGTLLWPMTIAALSSATAGANLAVAPPGYLFRTAVNEALNFKTNGSTVTSVQLGVAYYQAP